MAALLDAAMAKYGGKSWTLRVLESPASGLKTEEMIDEPLDLSSFVSNVYREITGMATVTILFDVQMPVPEFGPVNLLMEAALHNDIESLPDPIRPPRDLPDGCRLGLVVRNMADGTMQVLKIFIFRDKIHVKDAAGYCAGTPFALVHRPGPWALKKALCSVIDRLPGFHVSWYALDIVESKPVPARRSQSSQWAPPDDELLAGIPYINEFAPECDSQNQQYYWILCQIRDDSRSPISGWPEAMVRIMAQNKAKGMAGAQLETDFPLHTYSLKPFLAESLMPLLYPLFMNFAFMFLVARGRKNACYHPRAWIFLHQQGGGEPSR